MMIFLLLFSFSPQYGAGQQCCYDSTGTQILTYDSTGGSTPDRGHDWGSPPFLKPPRIPGFSHWLYDVISFYYCCLWSDNCDFYMKRRPSSDCRTYRPSRAGKAPKYPCGVEIFHTVLASRILVYVHIWVYNGEVTMSCEEILWKVSLDLSLTKSVCVVRGHEWVVWLLKEALSKV